MMMTEDSRAVPLLKNPRHEKFALALAEGKSATDAYALAGYKPGRQNAHRMTTKDDIQARLVEIQGAAAKASEVTIESLLSELEEARQKASSLDQLSAAVRAIEAKAKVSGLLIQRVEIGGPNEFAGCKTEAETVDKLLEIEAPGTHFTTQDRARVLEMFRGVAEFINSCTAKPVNSPAYPSQRQIEIAGSGNGFGRMVGKGLG
jgi:phage terminase small subunit